MNRSLNPLLAFVIATVCSIVWMSAFVCFSDSVYPKSVSNIWGNIGFVWMPVISAMSIQAFSAISLKMSLVRGTLLSLSSAILAPSIGASILMLSGLILFDWQM